MAQPPDAFQNKFYLISHDYFAKNCIYNFREPKLGLKITIFAISSRGHVTGIKSQIIMLKLLNLFLCYKKLKKIYKSGEHSIKYQNLDT